MPPPENGNEYKDFRELIALEKISSNVFRSTALAFGPANGNRTYGGHVYMQACYAAAQTVPKDFTLHQVTGWFLLLGKADEKFIYTVRNIRDGGYCTRGVDVVQENNPTCCFTCICSFKKPEKKSLPSMDLAPTINLKNQFKLVLADKTPWDHEEMPGVDAPWYWAYSAQNNNYRDPFPGLHLRKVDMDAYNENKPPLEKRNLKYYSAQGSMPTWENDSNMHACAHAYGSDRNSLFTVSNNFGVGDNYSQLASLSHTVIFHASPEELSMTDPATGQARWFCQEAWAGGARHGRCLHHSRIWREDGLLVATTVQDGMMRLKGEGDGDGRAGFDPKGMEKNLDASRQKAKM